MLRVTPSHEAIIRNRRRRINIRVYFTVDIDIDIKARSGGFVHVYNII